MFYTPWLILVALSGLLVFLYFAPYIMARGFYQGKIAAYEAYYKRNPQKGDPDNGVPV